MLCYQDVNMGGLIMSNEKLSKFDYNSTIRDLSKQYQFLNENPSLNNTSIGREASARLNTLDKTVNPSGPNVPLTRSIEDLLK